MSRWLVSLPIMLLVACASQASEGDWLKGKLEWTTGEALVLPADRPEDPCHAIKDPTVVQYQGQWHVFCTIRSQKRTHQIEYLSFADWTNANAAPRHLLKVTEGYYCAPQVFYFQPHKKWYLIYQAVDKSQTPEYFGPAYSTSDDIGNPDSWSKTAFMKIPKPKDGRWIDFWVICDEAKAYLFFTSLDGKMWRAEAKLADFPHGWSAPTLCLQGDIFEASHTYRLKGTNQYLTLVEAQDSGRRYYKAYLAESLGGAWRELAATREKPFASRANVKQAGSQWTDSISHGELLRIGYDEKLEVDPHNLRFLFQGVSDKAKAGKDYGQIPWRLGILDLQN